MSLPPPISSNQSPELPSLNDQIDTLVAGLSKMQSESTLSSYEKEMYLHIFAAIHAAFPSFSTSLDDVLEQPEMLGETIESLKEMKLRPL